MSSIRFLLLLLIIAATPALAQIPRTFSFQGVLADGSGGAVPNGTHTLVLKIYNNFGTEVYTETQSVPTVGGIFNAIVGSVTPIPPTVTFDAQYTLGVSVDGGAELAPRTPLASVPTAMRAGMAEALAPGATGVVTSINGGDGAIVLAGGGGTTINRVGNTVTISSAGGGGTGIAGVQSPDASLNITSPNGPVAGITIADGGVTSEKIAASAVTPAKISSATATEGNALVFRSGSVSWGTPNAMLVLPYTQVSSAAQDLFSLTSSSPFGAGYFRNTNTSPTRSALYGEINIVSATTTVAGVEGKSTNGFGVLGQGGSGSSAIFGRVLTTPTGGSFYAGTGVSGFSDAGYGVGGVTYSNSHAGVYGTATGTGVGVKGLSTNGMAGLFEITTSTNTSHALTGTTNGAGVGVLGQNSAATGSTIAVKGEVSSASHGVGATGGVTGVQGVVTPTTPGGYSAGVRGVNNGTGGTGIGVVGYQAGSGWGVYGETPSGFGVYGLTTNNTAVSAGVRGETFSTNGIGVEAKYSGTGVGTALEVDNGAIKVAGVNKAAFVHTATPGNKLSANGTDIDNPMCNGDATAILFVTQKLNPSGIVYNNSPIGVYYNTIRNKWEIFNENNVAIPNNAQFNVLVIKQ
jgi:hypothetical protein